MFTDIGSTAVLEKVVMAGLLLLMACLTYYNWPHGMPTITVHF